MFKQFREGDIVRFRKPHPCGNSDWLIMYSGIDCRIKCLKCGRILMVPRQKVEKSMRKVIGRIEQLTTSNTNIEQQ